MSEESVTTITTIGAASDDDIGQAFSDYSYQSPPTFAWTKEAQTMFGSNGKGIMTQSNFIITKRIAKTNTNGHFTLQSINKVPFEDLKQAMIAHNNFEKTLFPNGDGNMLNAEGMFVEAQIQLFTEPLQAEMNRYNERVKEKKAQERLMGLKKRAFAEACTEYCNLYEKVNDGELTPDEAHDQREGYKAKLQKLMDEDK